MNIRSKLPRARIRSAIPRVAVLVDTSTTWGRRVITGIHNHSRRHAAWQIFVEARGLEEHLSVPAEWSVEGVIARVATEKMARQLDSLGVPVINVSGIELPAATFPRVSTDMPATASLAIKHFQERGFQNFAYFSLLGLSYVSSQQDAFVHVVRQAGHGCALFGVRTHAGAEPDWSFDLQKLAAWLKDLPKPIAVFTWNASSAREILFGCQAAGILVPEEVAVLSGADDDLLCEVSYIPISAVMVAAEQIGFQAAALLDRWLTKRSVPKKNILIPPLQVVTRQSSDTLAIKDRALVKALNFIRGKADQPIQVNEVAAHAGISRRSLERRFSQVLGRSPAEEIRRHHLEVAKKLLGDTDMRIPEIADAAGFGSPEYMAYVFRRELGLNPRRYRKNIKSR
jgi:LacI family transcriptional regulator